MRSRRGAEHRGRGPRDGPDLPVARPAPGPSHTLGSGTWALRLRGTPERCHGQGASDPLAPAARRCEALGGHFPFRETEHCVGRARLSPRWGESQYTDFMARGGKRLALGAALLASAVALAAGVVASRWRALTAETGRWEAGVIWGRVSISRRLEHHGSGRGPSLRLDRIPDEERSELSFDDPVQEIEDWRRDGLLDVWVNTPLVSISAVNEPRFSSNHVAVEVSAVAWPVPVLVALVGVGPFAGGIRARRRFRAGLCETCGYDLAGARVGALCPECGVGARASKAGVSDGR